MLTINPQFRDADDTLDFLAKKAGFLGKVGGFLGGKAQFLASMDELGFEDTFSLQEFVVTGTQVRGPERKCEPRPLVVPSDDPRGGRGVAATRLCGPSSPPRRRRVSDLATASACPTRKIHA